MLTELTVSRLAKEEALKERNDLQHRHEVLRDYFNARENELQKQLGLQSARLGDAEQGSESSCKQLVMLTEEVELYKSQVKSLKTEMEDQVGALSSELNIHTVFIYLTTPVSTVYYTVYQAKIWWDMLTYDES